MDTITVQTNPATDIGVNQMTLNGELSSLDTSVFDMALCYFFYSTSVDGEGNLVDPIRIPDSGDVGLFDVGAFFFVFDGLLSETQYHFQAEGRTIVYSDSDAMDYLVNSRGGMDAVAASATVMDAFASSETYMDAVVAASAAMDAITVSEMAMDTLTDSEVAMGVILGVSFPYAFSHATVTHEMDRIRITRNAEDDTPRFLQVAAGTLIDFSEKSTLQIYACANGLSDSRYENRMQAVVQIDGDEVLRLDADQQDFILREIDVSGYSGRLLLELGYQSWPAGGDSPYFVEYGTFYLS